MKKIDVRAKLRAAGGRYNVTWWGARTDKGSASFHSERAAAQHLANIERMLDAEHTVNTQWHVSLTDADASIERA